MPKSIVSWPNTMTSTIWRKRCGRPARGGPTCGTPRVSNWACGASWKQGPFQAFTDTFENLHGLQQLPGLAVQRLMADGYGFGAEGDWKHAALVRTLKVMAAGLPGGTSFMEDYTYHFDPQGSKVLGAHMLEICPSLAAARPSCEIHPLGIGGKSDPVRLVFDSQTGPAVNASLVDLGDRFRLVVNTVDVVTPEAALAKTAGGPRSVGAAARSADSRGGLDLRRWGPSHRL